MADANIRTEVNQDKKLYTALEFYSDVDENMTHLNGLTTAGDLLVNEIINTQRPEENPPLDALIIVFWGMQKRVESLVKAQDRRDGRAA